MNSSKNQSIFWLRKAMTWGSSHRRWRERRWQHRICGWATEHRRSKPSSPQRTCSFCTAPWRTQSLHSSFSLLCRRACYCSTAFRGQRTWRWGWCRSLIGWWRCMCCIPGWAGLFVDLKQLGLSATTTILPLPSMASSLWTPSVMPSLDQFPVIKYRCV